MNSDPRELDSAVNDFQLQWHSGNRPSIATFLARVDPTLQPLLAQRLIVFDIEQRRRLGEQLDIMVEYGELVPEIRSWLQAQQGLEQPSLMKDDPNNATVTFGENRLDSGSNEGRGGAQFGGNRFIGPYRLTTLLGQGGMGEVWLAEQEKPVRRQVAVKVIKSGGSSSEILARFEAERQALALMDHPNIARILDAGATVDGQPFFAMELVQGYPITEYCNINKLGITDRLHLFMDACRGVQHAHQKGIIHRDLKPSNILVGVVEGKPVPKIIDFGLAKALENVNRLTDKSLFTGIGQILGTLRYMSPEQAALNPQDVDTRTDIYSLGIVLYELLTGATPLDDETLRDQAVLSVLELIRNKEPLKPSSRLSNSGRKLVSITQERRTDSSSLNKILVGDLDWIVMKAIEKDRARRYESASGFAMDIGRFLANEPVLARPPSVRYRVNKFVAKNRFLVVSAATILAALVLGIFGTSFGLYRAQQAETLAQERLKDSVAAQKEEALQRRLADRRRIEAEGATKEATIAKELAEVRQKQLARGIEILAGVFDDLDIGKIREGNDPIEQVLANRLIASSKLLEEEAVGVPLEVAGLQIKLSMALISLGFPQPAVELLQKVLETETRLEGEDSDAVLATYLNLATAYEKSGEPESALPLVENALEGNRRKYGAQHAATLVCLSRYANLLLARGEFQKAIPILQETLATQQQLLPGDSKEKLITMSLLGQALSNSGDVEKALPLFEEVMNLTQTLYPKGHMTTLSSMNNLAASYLQNNEFDKATELFEKTLQLSQVHLGESHPDTIASINSLAMSYQYQGRFDEAVKLFEYSVARQVTKLGADHPETLINKNNLALAYKAAGKPETALSIAKETLTLFEAKLGPTHPDTLTCMNTLASLLVETGKPNEAKAIRIRCIEEMKKSYGEKHPLTLRSISNLAADHSALGEHSVAIDLLQETLVIREAELGTTHPDTLLNKRSLGVQFAYLGSLEKAIPLVESALEGQKMVLGPDHPETLSTLGSLAAMYGDSKTPEKAIPLLEQTIAAQKTALGANHPDVIAYTNDLVMSYTQSRLWEKALPLAKSNLEIATMTLGESNSITRDVMCAYATVLQSTGDTEQAISLLTDVLSKERSHSGNDHPDTIDTLFALANAFIASQNDAKAIELLEEAANGIEKMRFGYRSTPRTIRCLTDTYGRLGQWDKSESWHRKYCDFLRLEGTERVDDLVSELSLLGSNLLKQEKWNDAQTAFVEAIDLKSKEEVESWELYHLKSQLGLVLLGQKNYDESERMLKEIYLAMKSKINLATDSERAIALKTLDSLERLYQSRDNAAEVEKWKAEKAEWSK